MTDARDNRRAARRLWVWPVAILVSFRSVAILPTWS
jgi:hypothetical protein